MTREISDDNQLLKIYLNEFTFRNALNNPRFIQSLTSMHKKAYAYLLFIIEIEKQNISENLLNKTSLLYFKETSSDIIQSIFCWATGSYKTANLMLRSSIETFLKAVIGIQYEEVFDEKSVYKIFEITKEHQFFSTNLGQTKFNEIHSIYKELCKTAHSARNIELGTITSLNLLPRYDDTLAQKYNKEFLNLLESILSIILLNFHMYIYNMHPLNTSNFLSAISFNTKREVFEYIAI